MTDVTAGYGRFSDLIKYFGKNIVLHLHQTFTNYSLNTIIACHFFLKYYNSIYKSHFSHVGKVGMKSF